jgi:hypothetical protein
VIASQRSTESFMTIKRILVSGVIIAATAATVLANLAQPAAAGGLSRDEAALVAGIGGLIIGATIAAPSFHHHHPTYDVGYDGSSAWERHVERCYARYRSYDHRTDTFVGYDGGEHYCQL